MKNSTLLGSLFLGGGLIGLWAGTAFFSALSYSNWQLSKLFSQYLVAIGIVKKFHTFVDYYTHVKGIEYLICVAFFLAFPVFYKYIHGSEQKIVVKK